jgi:hypothetical protein
VLELHWCFCWLQNQRSCERPSRKLIPLKISSDYGRRNAVLALMFAQHWLLGESSCFERGLLSVLDQGHKSVHISNPHTGNVR